METYPSVLPAWQRGYNYSPNNNGVLRSQFSTGRARQRRVANVRDDVFSCELLLNPGELVIFEHFADQLIGRVNWFLGAYHDGRGMRDGVLRLVDGDYQVQQRADAELYQVRAQIEVQERVMSDDDVNDAYFYSIGIVQGVEHIEQAFDNWYTG